MGAYRLYLTDGDAEGFKARIIHKVLNGNLATAGNLTQSAEERQSSMTTAGFNRSADYLSRFSRGSTGPAGGQGFHPQIGGHTALRPNTNTTNTRFQQRLLRPITAEDSQPSQYAELGSSQDRYLPIIINLESQGLLDEPAASLLKTLILEENVDVFRQINGYIARAIDEQELCSKLVRLAQ
jgi:hypothetical protein